MEKIRILIADDHTLVREGTRERLEREEDFEVVGEAADGEEAVRLAQELKPNVAIIDIAMPNLNGIDATKQIKANQPATAILVLSAYDNDQYIYAVLEAGANGYLLKNVRGAQLVDAIRDVSAGEVVLDPHVARKVVQWFSSMSHGKSVVEGLPEHFSERELEVLRLAAKGMSNKEIAAGACPERAHGAVAPGQHLRQAGCELAHGGSTSRAQRRLDIAGKRLYG